MKLVHWTREKIEECDEWARDRKMEMPDSMVLKGTLTCINPGRPLDKMYGGGMSGGGGSRELYRGVYEGRGVAIKVLDIDRKNKKKILVCLYARLNDLVGINSRVGITSEDTGA